MKELRFIWIILFVTFSLKQGSTQNEISVANGYADKGEHVEAIQKYLQGISSGQSNATSHFNLANSFLALDSTAQAILHYEKALRYDPTDESIKNNLEIARSRVVDQVTVLPEFFLIDLWNRITLTISPNGWAWCSVLFAILLVALYYMINYRSINLKRRYVFLISGLLLLGMIISLTASIAGKKRAITTNQAIIMKEGLLKSGPDPRSDDLKLLHPGYKVYILDDLNGWKKIRTEDREIGYVLPGWMEEI